MYDAQVCRRQFMCILRLHTLCLLCNSNKDSLVIIFYRSQIYNQICKKISQIKSFVWDLINKINTLIQFLLLTFNILTRCNSSWQNEVVKTSYYIKIYLNNFDLFEFIIEKSIAYKLIELFPCLCVWILC